LLTVSIVAIVQHQEIYNRLYSWKLIPRPERLTELYFGDHINLPKTYTPTQQQTVAFAVHDLEYRTTVYTYTIAQQYQDQTAGQQLASGTFTLAQDGTRQMQVPITLIDMGDRSRVLVTISYEGIAFGQDNPSVQTQYIDYWLTKETVRQ
jgi:hypothetical protein